MADQTISSILTGESISISMDGEMNGNLNAALIKRTKKKHEKLNFDILPTLFIAFGAYYSLIFLRLPHS